MNLKICLLLINIFTAEVLNWFSFFILYLGWTARFINKEGTMCKLFHSLFIITGLLKLAGTSFFAVCVYVFIKHGDKKLKWYIIIPCIVVTWTVVSTTLGVPPYLKDYGAQSFRGFCIVNISSGLFLGMCVLVILGALFFLSIQLIWCILTIIYMKRNVLEEDIPMKKAIAKVLGYYGCCFSSILHQYCSSWLNCSDINYFN